MSEKILICDDDEKTRESLKLILGDHYPLILTEDGSQCLECLSNADDISLVLLDIKMPQADGLEILRQIKEQYPRIRVTIITGYNSVETAAEAVRLGASGYIIKPFKPDDILSLVNPGKTA